MNTWPLRKNFTMVFWNQKDERLLKSKQMNKSPRPARNPRGFILLNACCMVSSLGNLFQVGLYVVLDHELFFKLFTSDLYASSALRKYLTSYICKRSDVFRFCMISSGDCVILLNVWDQDLLPLATQLILDLFQTCQCIFRALYKGLCGGHFNTGCLWLLCINLPCKNCCLPNINWKVIIHISRRLFSLYEIIYIGTLVPISSWLFLTLILISLGHYLVSKAAQKLQNLFFFGSYHHHLQSCWLEDRKSALSQGAKNVV